MEDLGLTQSFWQGKKVLLTGHTGFKGAWLSLWLQELGTHLIGYALNPPTEPNLFQVAGVECGMTSILGDIRDLDHLTAVFEQHRPEIVIHCAAQALVRQSYLEPVETYQTNVMGTVHVLEAARRCQSAKAVIVVTSDKCYENREWTWPYRENDRLGGHDPYSSSKACAELVATSYYRSFCLSASKSEPPLRVATVRAGNVIGGGDWGQDRLIPDCIKSLVQCRPIQLRFPSAVRPWQHVLEPLSGYMTLAKCLVGEDGGLFCEAWNFGPDSGGNVTVFDVAQQVSRLWGGGSVEHLAREDLPLEAGLLRLDATKAAMRLGWQPRWSFERAIKETVAWYKAWDDGEDMRAYTIREISVYEAGE